MKAVRRHSRIIAMQSGPGRTREAARLRLAHDPHFGWPFAEPDKAAELIQSGEADIVALPVFNTTTGVNHETLAWINRSGLESLDEFTLGIQHWLIAPAHVRASRIRNVLAPRSVIAESWWWLQARSFRAREFPLEVEAAADVALARDDTALIGPRSIAEATGLRVLQGPVQDNRANRTTFRLVGRPGGEAALRETSRVTDGVVHA